MIAEAVVDCSDTDDEAIAIFTLMEERLTLPFKTIVLGIEVTVDRIDLDDANTIVAACRRGRFRQRVPVLDLPLPDPKPEGADWIEAYRRWIRLA